jgi:hypothetical protein
MPPIEIVAGWGKISQLGFEMTRFGSCQQTRGIFFFRLTIQNSLNKGQKHFFSSTMVL